MFGRDAGAEIAHEEFDRMGNGTSAKHDLPAGRAVFKGVVYQVGKNLMNGFTVGEDARQVLDRGEIAVRQRSVAAGSDRRILNL